MPILYLLLFLFLLPTQTYAQISADHWNGGAVRVGPSTTICDGNARGAIKYDSVAGILKFCDGSAWGSIASTTSGGCTGPGAFSFTNLTSQSPGTLVYSNTITPSGCGASSMAVTISGSGMPQFSINGGAWTTSGAINPGETIRLRMTTSNSVSTTLSAVVVIGTTTGTTWATTTMNGVLKIFVTSASYFSTAIGSLSNADALCQSQAGLLGYDGSYKALLSDETTSAKDRLTITYPIIRASDGVVVAATNLWSGTLDNAIGTGGVDVWTGTKTDGTKDTGNTCTSWTSASGPAFVGKADKTFGGDGRFDYENHSWIHTGNYGNTPFSCSAQWRLYCLQQ